MRWYSHENGDTLGEIGPTGGVVLQDDAWGDPDDPEAADARVTLERDSVEVAAPFAVTVQLYGGWLYETFGVADRQRANSLFEAARRDLETLTEQVPDEDDADIGGAVQALLQAATQVSARLREHSDQ